MDIPRENGLAPEVGLHALFGGIPDVESESVTILPSPRVSPDIFHDIPGLAVTSESEDNSGKFCIFFCPMSIDIAGKG